jgi:large subunit ribosomal protein L1
MKRSKNYRKNADLVDRERLYSPLEAANLAKDTAATSKMDPTVEVAMRLGVDPRKADQMVRGTLMLPNGTGKTRRVAVFAVGENAREAEEAGADIVGSDDLAARIRDENFTEFDVAVATPDQMSIVGRLGQILGPRGLMPNPKSGTVTPNVGRAVEDIKRGKVEYRVDRYGIVHGIIGKKSFDLDSLVENYFALRDELQRVRPAAVKGRYFRSIAITSTMGPSIRVDPTIERD